MLEIGNATSCLYVRGVSSYLECSVKMVGPSEP